MKILQLSDLHLPGSPDGELFGSRPLSRLYAVVDDILAHHTDAQFCLLTGDLSDSGADSAYAALVEALQVLPMPVHVLPGNHDRRGALQRHFPSTGTDSAGFLQTAIETPFGRFLLLDTVETGAPWGSYCMQRGNWLAEQLAANDDPVWLAMHHPPFPVGIPSMDQYALRDSAVLRATLLPHRARIRHLFFGHLHRPIGGSWLGIPISCTASPNHQVALDLHTLRGDAVPGCREPAGYALILIDEERTVVHHRLLNDDAPAFWL